MADSVKTIDDGSLVATFMLGEAVFGILADNVQEVVKTGDITPVHQAPAHVVGIRNLRGRIVTVLDLAVRLDMGSVNTGPDNRILIVEWQNEPVGLLVDSVADAVPVASDDVMPAPSNLHGVQAYNLMGVFRHGERIVGLLDTGTVLQLDDESSDAALVGRATT